MSSNQSKEQGGGQENVIVFQNITQREDADSTIFSNQPQAVLPEPGHASSIKMKYIGQGYEQRKWLLFISILLLTVIVLLAVLVLKGDKTSNAGLQTSTTTQGRDSNQSGNQAQSKNQGRPNSVDKNVDKAPNPEPPVTVVPPPTHQSQPKPPNQPESKPAQPTTRPQQTNPPKSQSKPAVDLQDAKVLLENVMVAIDVPVTSAPGHSPSSQHKHNDLIFDYPTLGMPIPGRKYNDTRVSPEDLPLFDQTFNDLFKPYNDTDCEFVRYGKIDDGGYVLCKNFFSKSHALLNIGVNGQDSFGCDVTAAHPMPNYQYDCTNGIAPVCYKNKGLNYFSSVCVGSKTQKTQFHTFHSYEDILRSHNLTDKHITLKIDCEGGEYPGFKALPLKYLDLIDQIIIEIHLDTIYYEEWGMLDIFKTLADKFVNVNYHNNNWGCFQGPMMQRRKLKSRAPELTLVNKNLIKLKSESRSFALHPLNQRNGRQIPDCQMG